NAGPGGVGSGRRGCDRSGRVGGVTLMHQLYSSRSGFTLLELLLTLALSVVLLGLIAGLLQIYGQGMESADAEIRQIHLASAVMQMIEDDLRAALHAEPIDTEPLAQLLQSTSGQQQDGGGGNADGLAAAGIDDDMEESAVATASDLAVGIAVLETPGLIGNQFQIQIDTSRLPRLEEYIAVIDASTANVDDVPSDIKTVAYYVQPPGTVTGIDDPLAQLDSQPQDGAAGLVRRSLDRTASVYAAVEGNISSLNQTGELIAPEVLSIEFSYWDGFQWQIEWSSDEMGELPLAVKVVMQVSDPNTALGAEVDALVEPRTFAHVVRLPMARVIEEEDDAALTEAGI
ncbi:MAG: prepilin-type N-terminal cleavage/methylation domain-containing protein, partial [Planctomycetota bacterium]